MSETSEMKNNFELKIENNNQFKDNINDNTEKINKNNNFKEENNNILNKNYLSPKNKEISYIYPIKNENNYPYYFKYSNSNIGDDFHKTKKFFNNYNNENKINIIKDYQNKNEIQNEMNNNYKIDNNNNNYNSWYEKFKKSKLYNERGNENLIKNNEYKEYEEIIENNFISNKNDNYLNKEIKNIMNIIKQVNSQNNSEENFFIKNKYNELF